MLYLPSEANFARLDCNFCFVLSVVSFFPLEAFFSFVTPQIYLVFHAGVLEREKQKLKTKKQTLMFSTCMSSNKTKQNLHTLFLNARKQGGKKERKRNSSFQVRTANRPFCLFFPGVSLKSIFKLATWILF